MCRTAQKPRPLTAEQAETLNSVWDDIQSLIAAQITRRKLWNVLDEIMGDAITRTTHAVSAYNLTTPEQIKSRARSCALDAIRIAARGWRTTGEFIKEMITRSETSSHNGQVIVSMRGSAPVAALDHKITRRNFRPELFYAAMTIEDGNPVLQFASYGPEFIE